MALGLTADKPMSDTMIAKGRVQRRCPSVTVTQDGLTRTSNAAPLLARPAPQAPVCMPKSASDRIKDRNKQLESKPKLGKERALVRAREAIGVLRELEIDDDAILNELGLTAERAPKKAATDRSGRKLAFSDRSRTVSLRRRALPLTKLAKAR
jgi:hypothetical protein